jgi:hypothetical protein
MFDPTKFLMREDERQVEKRLKLFVRFGYLPERGFSYNKLNRYFEAGVSCFDVESIRGDLLKYSCLTSVSRKPKRKF